MAPRVAEKAKAKKENADRRKRILASQEKVLKIKRDVLSIVESMLEEEISKEWFLKSCVNLCHGDYDDVIQERNIEHLCGYPLCSNPMTQTSKQKYHISKSENKVYDLTERKNFCGNVCYKASQYLKAQLSPIPLYMRKEEDIKVHLLSDCDNKGSIGEEIVFHHKIPKDEIEKVPTVEKPTSNFTKLLNDELKNCSDSLSGLKITEHVFEKQFIFEPQAAEKTEEASDKENDSCSNSGLDNDDSDDEKLFPAYDNVSVLAETHMPVPKKNVKAKLISPVPVKPQITKSPILPQSLDHIFDIFKDWMTEDTMKYLLGEKCVYGLKADHLFEQMTTDSISSEKLASIKNEYIDLCLKIDKLPDNDDIDDSEIDFLSYAETKHNPSRNPESDITSNKKSFKRRPPNNPKTKGKRVSFASDDNVTSKTIINIADSDVSNSSSNIKLGDQEKSTDVRYEYRIPISIIQPKMQALNMEEGEHELLDTDTTDAISTSSSPAYEGGLPFVDSVSQNALRKQVLMSRLKAVFNDLLPIIGLHYTDIRGSVKAFVDTLSLTPTNVMFKPKEWKLISLILLRILTRTVLKDLHDEEKFLKLCQDVYIPTKIDFIDIEKLAHDLLSPENVLTLPICSIDQ